MSGRDITIAVNGVYFDQMLHGTKNEEYRLATDYWRKRLIGRDWRNIVLTRGYPKKGGVEGATRLTRGWNGAVERQITHPHFGPTPVAVFAIDVTEQPQ